VKKLLEPRAFGSGVFCDHNQRAYVVGGNNGKEDLKTCEKYNKDTNEWESI
jgi:hypothetical protein